jgi:hypothetical protein
MDMIYEVRSVADGRVFSGLHDTLLPLETKIRSIFQQFRNFRGSNKTKAKTKKSKAPEDAEKRRKRVNVRQNCGSNHWIRPDPLAVVASVSPFLSIG